MSYSTGNTPLEKTICTWKGTQAQGMAYIHDRPSLSFPAEKPKA